MPRKVARSIVQWALPSQLQLALDAPSSIILKSSDASLTCLQDDHNPSLVLVLGSDIMFFIQGRKQEKNMQHEKHSGGSGVRYM